MSDAPVPDFPQDLIDPATVQQLLDLDDGGYALIGEMVQLFREDHLPRMEALRQAVAEGRNPAILEVAHAVKGASSTMGALQVRAVAAALEAGARAGGFDTPPDDQVAELDRRYQEALLALERLVEQGRAQG